MDSEEIVEILRKLRRYGSDDQSIEVKTAAGGLPKSIAETLSAFSNGSGGTMILGISEKDGFIPAQDFDAHAISEALAQCCRSKLTPALQPHISVMDYMDSLIVVASITELPPAEKPCYVTTRGAYGGSFIRVSDGDRKLTPYEIERLLEERTQPKHDMALVEDASMSDLSAELVEALLKRQRATHPRIFGMLSDDDALLSLHAIGKDEQGTLHPTIAGLVALGTYPQSFSPRLTVTFTCYPGRDKASTDGVKYSDAQTMAGPVTDVLEDTLQAVRRNMRVGGRLIDGFRHDMPEYPLDAVREAVVNAIMHRDYSAMGQGTQIQVNMYADRLEVLSPGGLYGAVTVDTLGEPGASSTRNAQLSALLESLPFHDGYVAENRGSGFQLMTALLEQNGNGKPEVHDSISIFTVTFHSATYQRAEQQAKLAEGSETNTSQIQTRGYSSIPDRARSGRQDDSHATSTSRQDAASSLSILERLMLEYIDAHDEATAPELAEALKTPRSTIAYQLRKLIGVGLIERTRPARSPRQSYRRMRSAMKNESEYSGQTAALCPV